MAKLFNLCGYYGMRNSGDDALLLATARGARQYLGAETLTVTTPNPIKLPEMQAFEPTLVAEPSFRGENRFRQCFSALGSKHVIFGGGSVLHCARDIQTKRLMMKLAGRGPHLALGVGVGPFASTKAERECKKFLQTCAFVGVRDQQSLAIAQDLAPDAAIELTFDLAPMLGPDLKQPQSAEHAHDTVGRRGIGVALCPVESLQGNDEIEHARLAKIASALREIYVQTGEPIFLFGLNGHATLGDERINHRLMSLIPADTPVFSLPYDPNPLRVMNRLGRLKALVSMRLHGSILAFMTDTPVISLAYHSKCEGWSEQVGMPADYRLDATCFSSSVLATSVIDGLHNGFAAATMRPSEAKMRASINFRRASRVFRTQQPRFQWHRPTHSAR